jgi:hypothetical protein
MGDGKATTSNNDGNQLCPCKKITRPVLFHNACLAEALLFLKTMFVFNTKLIFNQTIEPQKVSVKVVAHLHGLKHIHGFARDAQS